MSDHSEPGERRIVIAAGAVLAMALCTTGYYAFRLVTDDADPAAAPSSKGEQSTSTSPGPSASAAAATSGSEPTVEPADPAAADAREPARAAARAPASEATSAARQPDEPAKTTAAPPVEPTPTAEPSAEPSVAASATPPPSAVVAPVAEKPAPAAATATMVGAFVDKVGPQFRLLGVECVLDGKTVYSGPAGRSIELFRRPSGPGKHSLSVVARYQGNGSGVFSYFEGYRFTVKGGREFSTNAGGATRITITGVERGGKTAAFEERLGLTVTVQ